MQSSGLNIAFNTGAECSAQVQSTFCVDLRSQSLVVQSQLPLSKHRPSGDMSIEFICLLWCLSMAQLVFYLTSHNLMCVSQLPLAILLSYYGKRPKQFTEVAWPFKVQTGAPAYDYRYLCLPGYPTRLLFLDSSLSICLFGSN